MKILLSNCNNVCSKFCLVKIVRIWSYSGPYFPAFGLNISPYSVRMRENTDQNNSEYGHFSRSVCLAKIYKLLSTCLFKRNIFICCLIKYIMKLIICKHNTFAAVLYK